MERNKLSSFNPLKRASSPYNPNLAQSHLNFFANPSKLLKISLEEVKNQEPVPKISYQKNFVFSMNGKEIFHDHVLFVVPKLLSVKKICQKMSNN